MPGNPDVRPLPGGWTDHYDPHTQRWYYRHRSKTTWDHPLDLQAVDQVAYAPAQTLNEKPIAVQTQPKLSRAQLIYQSAFSDGNSPMIAPPSVHTPSEQASQRNGVQRSRSAQASLASSIPNTSSTRSPLPSIPDRAEPRMVQTIAVAPPKPIQPTSGHGGGHIQGSVGTSPSPASPTIANAPKYSPSSISSSPIQSWNHHASSTPNQQSSAIHSISSAQVAHHSLNQPLPPSPPSSSTFQGSRPTQQPQQYGVIPPTPPASAPPSSGFSGMQLTTPPTSTSLANGMQSPNSFSTVPPAQTQMYSPTRQQSYQSGVGPTLVTSNMQNYNPSHHVQQNSQSSISAAPQPTQHIHPHRAQTAPPAPSQFQAAAQPQSRGISRNTGMMLGMAAAGLVGGAILENVLSDGDNGSGMGDMFSNMSFGGGDGGDVVTDTFQSSTTYDFTADPSNQGGYDFTTTSYYSVSETTDGGNGNGDTGGSNWFNTGSDGQQNQNSSHSGHSMSSTVGNLIHHALSGNGGQSGQQQQSQASGINIGGVISHFSQGGHGGSSSNTSAPNQSTYHQASTYQMQHQGPYNPMQQPTQQHYAGHAPSHNSNHGQQQQSSALQNYGVAHQAYNSQYQPSLQHSNQHTGTSSHVDQPNHIQTYPQVQHSNQVQHPPPAQTQTRQPSQLTQIGTQVATKVATKLLVAGASAAIGAMITGN